MNNKNPYSWIYSLGISIMMWAYNKLPEEEKKKTWLYRYFMGIMGTQEKLNFPPWPEVTVEELAKDWQRLCRSISNERAKK